MLKGPSLSGTNMDKLLWPKGNPSSWEAFWLRGTHYLKHRPLQIQGEPPVISESIPFGGPYFSLSRNPLTVWCWLQISWTRNLIWVRSYGICMPTNHSNSHPLVAGNKSKTEHPQHWETALRVHPTELEVFRILPPDLKTFTLPMKYSLAPIPAGRWGMLAHQLVSKLQYYFTIGLAIQKTKEME